MAGHPVFGPEEGLFELRGPSTTWIWVHTCPEPKCDCRSALVLSTPAGRDALLTGGAAVRDAWQTGTGYLEVAATLKDITAFVLDIDTTEVSAPGGKEPLDLRGHPEIERVANLIDGNVLDEVGRLWCGAKGMPLPDQKAWVTPEAMEFVEDGALVPWQTVVTEVPKRSTLSLGTGAVAYRWNQGSFASRSKHSSSVMPSASTNHSSLCRRAHRLNRPLGK